MNKFLAAAIVFALRLFLVLCKYVACGAHEEKIKEILLLLLVFIYKLKHLLL